MNKKSADEVVDGFRDILKRYEGAVLTPELIEDRARNGSTWVLGMLAAGRACWRELFGEEDCHCPTCDTERDNWARMNGEAVG